jgi:hypothetical protein
LELKKGEAMKCNFLSVAGFLISTLLVWGAHVGNASAANPTVTFTCMETKPAATGYTVLAYDASPSAPTKPSTDCATALASLLAAGFTSVNISIQTYTAVSGWGAPNGVSGDGTYITYVLQNPSPVVSKVSPGFLIPIITLLLN